MTMDSQYTVRCRHCQAQIEPCEGRHGIWMHTLTRREECGRKVLHGDGSTSFYGTGSFARLA